MQELDDNVVLREYVERDSGEAFAALVARHVNKVYSVALRHTSNPSQAEEITQAVFVILASKAAGLGSRVILSGWLFKTARLTALTYLRSELRRARREQDAHMDTLSTQTELEMWQRIAPLLDTAMAGLNETDRNAVVLRFFDGKSNSEVGAALGASEGAAEKRISRALEKLRGFFLKRGVTSTADTFAGALCANSVQAAPATLAHSAAAVALTKNAAAATSTFSLAKATLIAMKTKTVVTVSAVIAVFLGVGAFYFSHSFAAAVPASDKINAPVQLSNAAARRDRKDPLFIIDADSSVRRTSHSAPAIHIKGPVPPTTPVAPGFSDVSFQKAGNSDSIHCPVDNNSPLLGKHIRITGWLKCKDVSYRAAAYMCVWSPQHGFVRFDDMVSRPALSGTADWQQFEFVTDVPNEPCAIFTGPDLYGSGEMWGDDFEIAVVPREVPITDDRIWCQANDNADVYSASIDYGALHDGHAPVCLTYTSPEPAPRTISTRWRKVIMDADTTKYPGRKVQMSGMIKTDNVSVRLEPRMQAWGWVKGKSKLLATDSMAKDYSLKGTLDWTPFTVACTIPKDTQRIETSFLLWGSGKAWIDLDSVKLEIVK